MSRPNGNNGSSYLCLCTVGSFAFGNASAGETEAGKMFLISSVKVPRRVTFFDLQACPIPISSNTLSSATQVSPENVICLSDPIGD